MMIKAKARKKLQARAGAALIVVLGVVMVITIVALAYLSRSDGELAYGQNMLLRTQADFLAESALEHARGLVLNPQEVSGEYWTGATGQQIEAGDFYYDVSVDPNETYSDSTRYCNYDVTCNAYRLIDGERTAQSNLKALLRVDQCIGYWSGAVWDRQLSSAMTVNGDVYSNGDLDILGTAAVDGDIFSDNTVSGTVSGQEYSSAGLSVEWPDVNIASFYSEYAFSSVVSPLSGQVLGPYVKCAGDLAITGDVQVNGMLIVEGNLVVSGTGNSLIAGKNVPALFVTGDVTIEADAAIDIEGLAVIDGQMSVSVDGADVNVLGALFVADGMIETTQDAVVLGDPQWQLVDGRTAVRFNGTNDKLEDYDADNYLNGLGEVTVSCWVKSDVTYQDRGIFFTSNTTGMDGKLGMRYDKDGAFGGGTRGIKASLETNLGYTQIESSSNKQFTTWQHLALVWKSSQSLKLYIDGVEDTPLYPGSALGGQITGVEKFMVGCGAKGYYWDGLIDDVRVYSRALDPNEVNQLSAGVDISSDLIAHWQLDEDGQREVVITAAPAKTAVWCFSAAGDREKWAQAGTAFYKVIRRY